MRDTRQILWLVGVLLSSVVGCHTTPKTVPTPIVVIDAETHAPVAGAQVRLWCPNPRGPDLGSDTSGITGADGIMQVRAITGDDVGLVLAVSAPGYLPEQSDFSLPPQPIPQSGTQRTAASPEPHVVEVFAGPRPSVELIVPTGYTGMVKAAVHVQQDPPVQVGQRVFRFTVDPTGAVDVVGPPIFKHGLGPDFRAQYADGTPLPMNVKGLDIGFRWLRCEGDVQYFVVGTEADWNAAHRLFVKDNPGSKGGGGGGQGGGGKGGRGGRNGGGGSQGGGGWNGGS